MDVPRGFRAGLVPAFAALILLIGAAGCGSTKVYKEDHFQVATTYWNMKPRTVFTMQGGVLAGEVVFHDRKGATKLRQQAGDGTDPDSLDYLGAEDSLKPMRDLAKLNRGSDAFAEHIGMNYRPMFEKGEFDVSFTLVLWLNAAGRAEHAVCVRNAKCPPEIIKSIIDEAEAWQFPPEKGTRLVRFQRTFNFHVMHHTDFKY